MKKENLLKKVIEMNYEALTGLNMDEIFEVDLMNFNLLQHNIYYLVECGKYRELQDYNTNLKNKVLAKYLLRNAKPE